MACRLASVSQSLIVLVSFLFAITNSVALAQQSLKPRQMPAKPSKEQCARSQLRMPLL